LYLYMAIERTSWFSYCCWSYSYYSW
jgi:hypothetical protein